MGLFAPIVPCIPISILTSQSYTGAALSAAGPFFEQDTNTTVPTGNPPIGGWPFYRPRFSFATISGFWDVQPNTSGSNYPWLNQYGWESFISGIPHPTALIFEFGDKHLDAKVDNTTISNFKTKITFKSGVGEWHYTWTPEEGGPEFEIEYELFYSRERPNVAATKVTITASEDVNGTITDLLDGRSAALSVAVDSGLDDDDVIHSSLYPLNLPDKVAYVVSGVDFNNSATDIGSRRQAEGAYVPSNATTIGQTFNISLTAGESVTFYKYIGIASSDKFESPEETARNAQSTAQEDGWDALLEETTAAWAEILTPDSVDDFSDPITGEAPEDINNLNLQVASVANTYYLLQQLMPDGSGLNDNSIAVGGLSSDAYAGLIFWDADYWIAPGINLNFPAFAKQIANYRLKQFDQALENAAFNNYPNGSALYSWTSGRYGNCTGTGPCVDYQYHLNTDIAFNMIQLYNITNNETWFNNGPKQLVYSVAQSMGELFQFNETDNSYWIYNMTDPDEYANNIDNGAFTLASGAELLKEANAFREADGLEKNTTWEAIYENIAFPKARSNITLEFETMNNSAAVKQADIVLLNYPLDYGVNYTEADKLLDLDYYANRQSPDGPAMTYSIFAIGANALSQSGCSAHTYTLNALTPYLRAPFFLFSEQVVDDPTINGNTNPASPFLTGHGGANQIVPFGFLGVRTDQPVLYLNPSLPPQIPHVKVRTFYYAGTTLSASMNLTHSNITRLPTVNSIRSGTIVDRFASSSLPFKVGTPGSGTSVDYTIAINETVILPNRLYWQEVTEAGNIIQCLSVTSPEPYAPGQFPEAAVDGATSTRWQPHTNETSSILVNMSSIPPQLVTGIFFDWGLRPPRHATVYLGNSTDGEVIYGEDVVVIPINNISPDLPFKELAEGEVIEGNDEVVPVIGNSTEIALAQGSGSWSGKYARLVIEGCWEEDGEGATVGEFVLRGVI